MTAIDWTMVALFFAVLVGIPLAAARKGAKARLLTTGTWNTIWKASGHRSCTSTKKGTPAFRQKRPASLAAVMDGTPQ